MKICPRCQSKLPDTAPVCGTCGTRQRDAKGTSTVLGHPGMSVEMAAELRRKRPYSGVLTPTNLSPDKTRQGGPPPAQGYPPPAQGYEPSQNSSYAPPEQAAPQAPSAKPYPSPGSTVVAQPRDLFAGPGVSRPEEPRQPPPYAAANRAPQAPPQNSPYAAPGAAGPPSAPPASNPYAPPGQAAAPSNAYAPARPVSPSSPPPRNPYAAPAASSPPANNPYAPPSQSASPYGAPPASSPPANNPYAAPASSPYGAPPAQTRPASPSSPPPSNPYGAPPAQARPASSSSPPPAGNPYGAPSAPPAAAPPNNPYGAPPSASPSAGDSSPGAFSPPGPAYGSHPGPPVLGASPEPAGRRARYAYDDGLTEEVKPLRPPGDYGDALLWDSNLSTQLLVFGVLLIACIVAPWQINGSQTAFSWSVLSQDLPLSAKLMPIVIGLTGIAAAVAGALRLGPNPRCLAAAGIGTLGLGYLLFGVGEIEWRSMTGVVGEVLLVSGLFLRGRNTEAMSGRVLATLGTLMVLSLYFIPDHGSMAFTSQLEAVGDNAGAMRLMPIVQDNGILRAILSAFGLLVWLPGTTRAATPFFAWSLLAWHVIAAIFVLVLQDNGLAALKSDLTQLFLPLASTAWLALCCFGSAGLIANREEG